MEDKKYEKPMWGDLPPKSVRELRKKAANPGMPTLSSKDIIARKKLNIFLEEFLQNGGDATAAAMKAGNYTTRGAASIAARNFYLKNLNDLGRLYLEQQGAGLGKFLQHALEKMEASKDPEWWDRLMKLAGYADFITKGGGNQGNTVTIIQTQENLRNEFGFGDDAVVEAEEVKGKDVDEKVS